MRNDQLATPSVFVGCGEPSNAVASSSRNELKTDRAESSLGGCGIFLVALR